MNRKQYFIGLIIASVFGGLIALGGFKIFESKEPQYDTFEERQNVMFSSLSIDTAGYDIPAGLNFVQSAKLVTPGVVHVKSTSEKSGSSGYRHPWEEFFNYPSQPQPSQAFGSGVIISDDGYITTNNHVIDNATEVEVTLFDNRKYDAKVIGTDPNTDLALLKIDETDLPFIRFGDSDNVQIGEWVLAVGNPFQLTSTVTAGIVSAKARNIRISNNQYGIESYIQTDAAVNPGNSGGALVNLKGELIGINTAIASRTGSYTGYSFAVPVSLVKKVMNDLKEFGAVQRALLGITIRDVTSEDAKELNLPKVKGVIVNGVNKNSSAEEAGIKEGDVVIAIEGKSVKNVSELQESVAVNRPGDKIKVTYIRNGKERSTYATLKNMMGDEEIVRVEGTMIEGATCTEISNELKEKLNIEGGVQLKDLKGGRWKDAGMKDNFVITTIADRDVNSLDDLMNLIASRRGKGTLVEGMYPDGEQAMYAISF